MTATATEQELKPTSKLRRFLWEAFKDRGWGVGTVLQCTTPNPQRYDARTKTMKEPDPKFDRVKIVEIRSYEENCRLNSEGKYDVTPDHPWFDKIGHNCGIITVCEYPPGGMKTVFSLNCRDWEEVAP